MINTSICTGCQLLGAQEHHHKYPFLAMVACDHFATQVASEHQILSGLTDTHHIKAT